MSTTRLRHVWQGLATAALFCALLSAQMTVTGTISGTVADPSGQGITGAKVTFTSVSTSDVRSAVAGEGGAFNLTAVQPDTYTMRVEQRGFKAYERRGVVVSANERVSIGDIVLQIGEVTETVSVVAQAAQVQTDSSEHSAVLTSNQLISLTARGREVVSMLRTIPGVQYQADQDSTGGSYGTGTPPATIALSTVQGTDLTGGGDGQRVNVVGNPNANGSTFNTWFNPAAFAAPGQGDPGNAAKNSVRNPGVNNTDLALSKRFPVKSEKRYITLRWEAYNAFNHTQYSGINVAPKYDLTTGAQTNPLFGQVSSTRAPRIMQGSLRFTF